MTDLARLEARLARLRELREVIRAMRGLASSRLREARAAQSGVQQFADTIARAFADVAIAADAKESFSAGGSTAPVLLVLTAEHGFVGGFAGELARQMAQRRLPEERVAVVGQKGATRIAELQPDLLWRMPAASHTSGVVTVARRIVARLGEISRLRLLYTKPVRGGWRPVCRTVLPPRLPRDAVGRRATMPLCHLPPPLLVRALVPELLFAEIVLALIATFASENAARLRAMERAERNIGERVQRLRQDCNRMRQEAITTELLDIVTGAEAVIGEDRQGEGE